MGPKRARHPEDGDHSATISTIASNNEEFATERCMQTAGGALSMALHGFGAVPTLATMIVHFWATLPVSSCRRPDARELPRKTSDRRTNKLVPAAR